MLTGAIYVEFEKMISVSKRLYATTKQGEGIYAPRLFCQNIPPIRLELYITTHVIKEMYVILILKKKKKKPVITLSIICYF